jgi:DinB superfamily
LLPSRYIADMRDRTKILDDLATQRAELERRYRQFPVEVLTASCTTSESDPTEQWSPKDHLAHFLRIEAAFLAMARRTIEGDPSPLKFAGSTRPEILAGIHRDNDDHVIYLRERTLDELFEELTEARSRTLEFIGTLTDDQLDKPIPHAPWSDGTIGGVLSANGIHEMQHLAWVDASLISSAES